MGTALSVAAGHVGGLSGQGAWDSPEALRLAERAIEARAHAFADSSLVSFRATAQGHVYFMGQLEAEREVIRADQIALDIRWQTPDRALQTIVGRRHEQRLPGEIRYHLDHLSLVLDNFGDRIRMGDGDEVRDAPHPAAPDALSHYEYQLADSLEIRIQGRRSRVFELRIRPRNPDEAAVVGSVFVDRGTGAIARMRLTFTRASYRDPNLVQIALDLRSGLIEGRYWLPVEQDLEITRAVRWFDFPVSSVIRTRLEVDRYEINGGIDLVVAAGSRVATYPDDVLEAFDAWREPLYGGPIDESDRSDEELDRAIRDATELVRSRPLVGGSRLQLWMPGISSALRVRRSEGLFAGSGLLYRPTPGVRARLWSGFATGASRGEIALALGFPIGLWDLEIEGRGQSLEDVGDRPAAGVTQTLGLLLTGEDYTDPFFEDRVTASLAGPIGRGRIGLGLSYRNQRRADLAVDDALIGSDPTRPIRPIDEGELVALDADLRLPLGEVGGGRVSTRLEAEAATSAVGDFGFARARGSLRWDRDRLASPWSGSAELSVGASAGDVPAQRLFLMGGRGTLPGYGFRPWGGDRMVFLRGEVARTVAHPWLRVRASAATGWTDLSDAGADAAARFGVVETGGLESSVGVGVGLFWDLIRVDVVRGLGGDPVPSFEPPIEAGGPPTLEELRPPTLGRWLLQISIDPAWWSIL